MNDNFTVPQQLEPDLGRVLHYWSSLKRGENNIPFSDDLNLSKLNELAKNTCLLEVFYNPLRIRFDIVGDNIAKLYGRALSGKFADEVETRAPLDRIVEQSEEVLRRQAPAYWRGETESYRYSRLMLPLWANGRIEMLLAAASVQR
jgi:hypothetical protein